MLRVMLIATWMVFISSPVWAQTFDYTCPEVEVQVEPGVDTVSFTVTPQILQTSGATAQSHGFAMAVSHNPNALNVVSVTNLLPFAPDYLVDSQYSNGWTVGAVYSAYGTFTFPFDTRVDVLEVTYETEPGYLTGQLQSLPLTFSDAIGSPPTSNVVVVAASAIPANFVHGSVTFLPSPFLRGDVNGDSLVDVADAIGALGNLFVGDTDPLPCMDAADINDDGAFDISDAIFLLSSLFTAEAPGVPEPTSCGPDPTDDTLSCGVGCPQP